MTIDVAAIGALDRASTLHPFTQLKDFATGKLGEPTIVETGKGIRIQVGREALTVSRQLLGRKTHAEHPGGSPRSQQGLALEIQHLAITSVGKALAVGAHSIDRRYVAQVLDSPRRQQPVLV